ncbi:UDP-N-acetylglucosamine--N-acetylmuramyl-(pentapeptide) pyrophosphoryl-undecaprenol N-acetylglucosamine transferase [Candidatus Pelagibacter sp.]|nr:UDP-N-acetylglucosamine--N-acetylmuramyl-(pentapeptide) pyrophosphoryl-undecaprenol N-acetylglucosamine transferase [Candidatus Pelagibacter sp.]
MKNKILITTGGSGGHVIPALNLYNHLKNEFDVYLYTDVRGAKYIPKEIRKTIFEVKKVPEKKYLFPIKIIFLFYAFIKSLIHFKGNKIDIIISTGGYMSLPIVMAAKIFNKKIILFEPNSIIGRSNKFLLRFAYQILCYDKSIIQSNNKKSIVPSYKGVVIDPILNNCFYSNQNTGENKDDKFKILIMGGSQASLFFSKHLKSEIIQLSKKYKIEVTQQLSSGFDIESYKKEYNENNIKNNLFFFEENFLCKKNNFDIAITRAGASSLAELAHLNIPFISIPFPHATDNHQFLNAKRYFDLNCCWILEEKNFNSGDIYEIINQIIADKNEYFEKKNNLIKLNENKTWQNINQKFIKYFNEN